MILDGFDIAMNDAAMLPRRPANGAGAACSIHFQVQGQAAFGTFANETLAFRAFSPSTNSHDVETFAVPALRNDSHTRDVRMVDLRGLLVPRAKKRDRTAREFFATLRSITLRRDDGIQKPYRVAAIKLSPFAPATELDRKSRRRPTSTSK